MPTFGAKPGGGGLGVSLGGGGGGSNIIVGVDLGPDSLRMAKTTGPAGKRKLLAFKRVPYDPGIALNSPEFAGFIRTQLKEFTGGKAAEIWSLISSAKAELWHITIPKVSKSQIAEAVFWSVKKEKQFDEAEFILDFDLLGDVTEKGVPKLAVTVYLAPRKQVEDLSNLFAKAGFKLSGVTIAPIAIQTLFRAKWMQTAAGTYANLYVGRNWSRIDIFLKGNLVLSRGIKAGTNSMVEALVDSYNIKAGKSSGNGGMETIVQDEPVISMNLDDEAMSITMGGGLGGTSPMSSIDFEQAKKLLASKLLGSGQMTGPGHELNESEIVEMILPAAERLVRQIERTFEYHSTTMGNEPVEQIYFSGVICTNKLILQYMYGQLGIESLILDPLQPENPALAKMSVPASVVERLEYNLVIALALSDNAHTPNLLYTYKNKEKDKQALRVEKIMYAVTVAVLLGLLGVWTWQRGTISEARSNLAKLEVEAAKFTPKATPEMLEGMAKKVNEKNKGLKKASLRYESLSVLSEINELTPTNIKALSVQLVLGPYVELKTSDQIDAAKAAKEPPKAASKTPKMVILDGFIEGLPIDNDNNAYKAAFSSFLIKLENSVLFDRPLIQEQKASEYGNKGNVYRFLIHIPMS